MPLPILAIAGAVGATAQLGQSIYAASQGRRMMREASKVKKPEYQVQAELEQNRAMALNRYNAYNPYVAQATANLNAQTASAGIMAQQTASDSAAALQAISQATQGANRATSNIMLQGDAMKQQRFGDVLSTGRDLAADKNRVTALEQADYLRAQQQKQAGMQTIMGGIQGVSNFAGDIFSMAAMYPGEFGGGNAMQASSPVGASPSAMRNIQAANNKVLGLASQEATTIKFP